MAKPDKTQITLLILAGIGAGTLLGATVGLLLARNAAPRTGEAAPESVDDLKEKAQQALGELTENVSELIGRSRQLLSETTPPS